MKKTTGYLCVILLLAMYWSCSKPYNEALPVVQFVSASAVGNDSIILIGNVTSSGADAVQYVGFAYAEQPSFDILSNQVLLNGTTGMFSWKVKALPDSTYYIKCFAANSFGYAATGNFKYTVPVGSPQSAPCASTIPANSVVDNKITYSMSVNYDNTYPQYGTVGIETSGFPSESVNIYFNGAPANGIYSTASDPTNFNFDSNPYDCVIMINSSYFTNSGGQVYVAVTSPGHGTITFCSIPYVVSSATYYISGNISY
ncbi:MAG TPA: hypothetical protein VK806_12960 [Bacteroidia bacterium]|jgi:hypothetical protein|nr:hypothetical protein [Bacteroidia bacterium]